MYEKDDLLEISIQTNENNSKHYTQLPRTNTKKSPVNINYQYCYIESYIINIWKQNLETIIGHAGTNDLKSDTTSKEITVNWKASCKIQTNKVILPSIVPQYYKLNEKTRWVNKCPKEEYEVWSIDQRNISPKYTCNIS